MTLNHLLLSLMGVSNSRLDSLVWASISAGAYGSKLTGGGGGGCVLALVDEKSLGTVEEALHNLDAPTMVLRMVEKGVYSEELE
jgi:mevalonate kinase